MQEPLSVRYCDITLVHFIPKKIVNKLMNCENCKMQRSIYFRIWKCGINIVDAAEIKYTSTSLEWQMSININVNFYFLEMCRLSITGPLSSSQINFLFNFLIFLRQDLSFNVFFGQFQPWFDTSTSTIIHFSYHEKKFNWNW